MNNLFMKITSYVIILALFLYFVFVQPSFNVLAASVSSLPKDLDISVDFDSDNIYVSYNGYDTTISRHTSTTFDNGYHYVYYSGTVYACKDYFAFGYFPPSAYNASVRYTYLPSELEKCNGKVANASYWLDPVSNCVYVFTSSFSGYYGMYSGITRMIDNYFVFPFSQSKTWPWIVTVTRIDLVTNVVTHYFDYAYSTTDGTKNGIFTLNTLYTFDYHGTDNIDLGDKYSRVSHQSPTYYYGNAAYSACGKSYSLPSGTVCIFANHKIEGFFDYDDSDVITPSYYFRYQYVFYKESYGFLFVDSSGKLDNIFQDRDTFDITLNFKNNCNFYCYFSSVGLSESWTNLVNYNTMYSSSFKVPKVSNFVNPNNESFKLIYCNDSDYGVSVKSWESFPDALDDLNTYDSWVDAVYQITQTDNPYDSSSSSKSEKIAYTIFGGLSGLASSLSLQFKDAWDIMSSLRSIPNEDADSVLMQALLLNTTFLKNAIIAPEYFNYFEYDKNLDSWVSIRQTSIYSLIKTLVDYNSDHSVLLKAIRTENFNSFKLLSSNLSLIYELQSDIKDLVCSIDYYSSFRSINGSFRSLLNTLPSLAFDDSSVIAAIKDISLSGSGGGTFNFDDSAILSRLDSIRDRMNYTFKPVLRDYDDDPDDDNTSVVDFVSTGLSDLVGGTVIQPIALAPGVLSAVTFVNTWIGNIWDNLGKLRPVVVLGLTFTVVNVVIRREEATA